MRSLLIALKVSLVDNSSTFSRKLQEHLVSELIGRTVPPDQHLAELQRKLFDQPVNSVDDAEAVCNKIRQEISANPADMASLRASLKTAAMVELGGQGSAEDTARNYAELALIDLATAPRDGTNSVVNQIFSETNMALIMDQQNAMLAAQNTLVEPQNQTGLGWVANLTRQNLNPTIGTVADYVQSQLPPNLHLHKPGS